MHGPYNIKFGHFLLISVIYFLLDPASWIFYSYSPVTEFIYYVYTTATQILPFCFLHFTFSINILKYKIHLTSKTAIQAKV
jgi:hypothetical protein